MNRILLILTFALAFVNKTISQTVQGTILTTGAPNTAVVYGKPSIAVNSQFRNILIAISIPDQGGSNPAVGISNNYVPSLTWTPFASNPIIFGGRAYYNFSSNLFPAGAASSWAAGGNNPIVELTFSNSNGFGGLQLNDESPAGGPNSQLFWYVEANGAGDITEYAQKFYGAGAVNNLNSPSFVAAQAAAPVFLKEFNVAKQGTGNALLTWITTYEENSSHFVIERSVKESNSWASIGEVKAKGNSAIDTKYSYTDANVYDGREVSKTFFYRLRSIDLDKSEKIFPVRSIRFSALGDKEITVFPNPAKGGFYVQIPIILRTDQKIRLNLMNRIGQVVDTREITAAVANNYYFDISAPSITSGDYVLDIIYDNQKLATKKLMISR